MMRNFGSVLIFFFVFVFAEFGAHQAACFSCDGPPISSKKTIHATSNRPPVIMIVLDDLFDYRTYRDYFGVTIKTPNLDKLATRGTTFSNAFCSIAVCNASRSSVLSGLSPIRTHIHQAEPFHFFDQLSVEDCLIQQVKQTGYEVWGTGKVMHGSAGLRERQFNLQMHDRFFQARGRVKLPAGSQFTASSDKLLADDKNVEWAVQQLATCDGTEAPLFLTVGIIRPHRPFVIPEKFLQQYDRNTIRVPRRRDNDLLDVSLFYRAFRLVYTYASNLISSQTEREFIHGYLASVSYADAKVGRLMEAIEANPHLAGARIILWSDHGYELGAKYTWNKFTLWESSTRVPLIVCDPQLPKGRTIKNVVSLLDVAPTIRDWAGADAPEFEDGISLLNYSTPAKKNRAREQGCHYDTIGLLFHSPPSDATKLIFRWND